MSHFHAQNADCFLFTFKEGLLSAVAHDLKLRVGNFTLDVDVDSEPPHILAKFQVSSIEVLHAMKEGQPAPNALSPADRQKIQETMLKEVLEAKRFPEVLFESRTVARMADGYRVNGSLTLKGVSRPVVAAIVEKPEGWVTEVTLHQPDFGIKPYQAMLGTLRVKPELRVRIETRGKG